MNMKRGMMFLLFLLVIPSVSAQVWYNAPIGYLGALNFANIYDTYALYFDAIIYLLIFLGLGMSVFGVVAANEPEKEKAYRLIYIGLALALTIGMLLAESRAGFTLLDKLGPFTAFILLMILIFSAYKIFNFFLENKWISISLTVGATLVFLDSFYTYFDGFPFLGALINDLIQSGFHRVLYIFAVLGLLAWIVKKFGLKATGEGTTVQRPTPSGVPPEVAAKIVQKDKIISGLENEIGSLRTAIADTEAKLQSAVQTGEQRVTDSLQEQFAIYQQKLAAVKKRRKEVLRKIYDGFVIEREKLKELAIKLEKQRDEIIDKLNKEVSEKGVKEYLELQITNLQAEIDRSGNQAKANEEAAQRMAEELKEIYAEGSAVKAPEYVEGEEEKLFSVMQPKPTPLLPAPEEKGILAEKFEREEGIVSESEIDRALQEAEAEKIIPAYVKKYKIPEMLKEIAKNRDMFEKIERETFLLQLFTKRGLPKRNILSVEFLNRLHTNISKLARAASFYINKYPKGKYSNLVTEFLLNYKKERLNFDRVQAYKQARKEVRLAINYIHRRYPNIAEAITKRLNEPTNIDLVIRHYIDKDDKLNDKEKEFLHSKVDEIQTSIKDYSSVLSEFFNELHKCKVVAEKILALQ